MRAFQFSGRRKFLGAVGGAALLGAAPAITRAATGTPFIPDLELELRATPDTVPILQGAPTQVWR